MNNLKKILSLALACMMLLSLLAGCGGQTSGGNEPSDSTGGEQSKGGSSTQGSEITIGVTSFADTLEPTEQYFSWVVSRYAIGETLLRFDEHGELVPCLAEEWSVSDDNLTWTFRIRQGVKFSNGEDMTPELVKASLERTFRLSDRAVGFFDPASIEVEGQDLKITTKVPSAIVPGSLADPLFLIVNTHVDDSTFAMSGPVCTGPYVVKSFSPTESCVVVRNPYYWDGEVPFDQVTLKCVDDQTTRSMALQTGEIDIAYNLKNENIAEFENNSNITIEQLESLRSTYAFMNQNGPLGDLTLRQALLRGLNKEAYCGNLLDGGATPGKAPVPPTLDFGFDQLKDENAYDPESAKALLAQAHPELTFSGGPDKWFGTVERDDSGRVSTVEVCGAPLRGVEVRRIFSLRSACFTIDAAADKVTFRVTGYGHGVGMSQYGANELARQGKTWQEILMWYYADITIGPVPETVQTAESVVN